MLWIRSYKGLINLSLASDIMITGLPPTLSVAAFFGDGDTETAISKHATKEEAQAALEEIATLLGAKTLKGGA